MAEDSTSNEVDLRLVARRHLRIQHGLAAGDYRARWNLSTNHPLIAPGYSARRSALAKMFGLGRWRQADPNPPVPKTLPGTKRRGRKPSQPVTISPEVAAAPAPKRRGRQRTSATA